MNPEMLEKVLAPSFRDFHGKPCRGCGKDVALTSYPGGPVWTPWPVGGPYWYCSVQCVEQAWPERKFIKFIWEEPMEGK